MAKNEAHETVNQILSDIAEASATLAELQRASDAMVQAAVEQAKGAYALRIDVAKKTIATLEKQLKITAKSKHAEVFGNRDRVDLPAGSVLWQVQDRVHRARGVLMNLKSIGRTDYLKITERVDWDKLETAPESFLGAIGTKRVKKASVDYELKEAACG